MWRKIFVLFFFLERITALEAPVDLATVDISTHSLSVMWRNLDGEANWFKATISPLDEGETTQGVKYINESVVTWVDLVPGKNYTISVVAISGNGRISLATQIVASTKPMPPYRVRLSKFANRALSAHSFGTGRLMMFPVYGAVVYWDGPDSGHFDGYELTVNPPHGVVRYTRGNALINQAIRRRRIVWDLMPGVLYEFNVRTRSNNVLSDSSSVSDRMPPDTPGFISIDHLTSTTANLSWGEPHRGIYDGFVVEIDPVDGGVEQPGLPTDKRRNLFGLTPGVRYLVEVYATSHGVLSYKPRNRTIEVPPMPPMRPVVASNVQSTAVTLSWQVPVHGRLDHFEVVYYPTLNDYRRLRHKVHDPLVTLTNLLPNTEYSLILFSVTNHTNLVFSKPLLATVRTGQYETTAIYRTTTSLAGVVVTAKDEGEEEGNENLVGGTEDPAKTATQTSLIDRIKSATTPKPDVNTIANGRTLPPHYSIPDVLSTIKPFPTTKYYQGRVTTYPSLNVNTETTDSWRTSSESASPTHTAETFTTAAMVRSTTRFPVVFRTTTNKFLVSTTFAPDKIEDTTTMAMLSTTKANGGPVEAVETTASQPKPRDQGKGDQTTSSPDMTVVFKPGDTASTASSLIPEVTEAMILGTTKTVEPNIFVTTVSTKTTSTEFVATTTSSTTDESVATASSTTDESVATTTRTSSTTDESVPTTTSSTTDKSVATTTYSTTDESVATTTSSTTDESVATKVSSSTTQSTSKTDKPIIRGGSGKTTTDSTNKTDSTPTKTKPGVNDSPPTTHATKQPSADASFSTTTPFSPLEPTEPLTTTYPVVVTGDVEVIPTTAVNQIGSGEGPTSDNGTTSNGGSEMTVGQDEGRTNRIQQGYSTICRPNNITVLVDKAVIANYERKYGPLHLNDELDPRCVGVEHPTYYRYTIAPNLMDCGTTIELNDTHVNFTNTVSNNKYRNEWYRNITDHGGTVILGNRAARNPGVFVNMRIWCTFPLDLSVSMAYPFLPQITQQVLTFNISGHGQFSAAMQLYKSNAYDDPYIAPPTLQSNETLYVGISLLETHNSTFMVVKRCWGTPERAHDHPRQYPIISDYCRVPESLGGSVKVMGNGEGRKVKWEGSVFKFIDFQQVWLHCEIRVCFGDDCKPDCEETTSRRKRSANSDGGSVHVISAGPISLDRPRGPVVESVASGTTTSPEAPAVDMEKTTVLIAVGGLCFVILICLVVIVGVLVRLHKKRRLQKNQNSSTESTTAFESRNFEAPVPDGSDYFEISRSTSHLQSFTPPPPSSGHGRVESSIRTVSQLKTVSNDNAAFLGSNSDTSSANKNINDKHNVAPNTNKTPGSGVTSHGANVIS